MNFAYNISTTDVMPLAQDAIVIYLAFILFNAHLAMLSFLMITMKVSGLRETKIKVNDACRMVMSE